MPSNDVIILDEFIKQRHENLEPSTSDGEFFELFTAEQVLKDFDLSYDEIDSGIVGGGNDGGIDAIYTFVNDELVNEDSDYSHLRHNIELHLVIIQAKLHAGFGETPIERFITVSQDILNLSKNPDSMSDIYNGKILESIQRFRGAHNMLLTRFPKLRITYYYASRGTTQSTGVKRKVEKLKEVVKGYFRKAECVFKFLGATELLSLARSLPQSTHTLSLAENPISSDGQIGFVCLVKLQDYYDFLKDEHGQLRRNIFEANVRDYQGPTAVNDDIRQALIDKTGEDFWWLNNGVTVIATKAAQSGKLLTIEDPQIVNGLQTSVVIFEYLGKGGITDDRKVLVRVIVPTENASRDRVIKATNSQTAVQQASLRATDKIHRDIEEYFRPRNIFYDRRKNFHKNEGKPRNKIVSIPYLAQTMMAIVLKRPDTARARPSSLLKKDADYEKVFNPILPISTYYVCTIVMRRIEERLRELEKLETKDKNNLRFYVAMYAIYCKLSNWYASAAEISVINVDDFSNGFLDQCINIVLDQYTKLGANDQIAKGSSLLEAVGQLDVVSELS